MSDRLSLSCWVKGFHPLNMLGHWEKLLQAFPYSRLTQALTVCRIHAVDFSEPILFEQGFPPPFSPASAVSAAQDFLGEDIACQVECYWDLMQLDGGWHMRPAPVSLWMFAPGFANDTSDHLRVELGLEDRFLPDSGDSASIRASHANLKSLMHLIQEISAKVPVERKHLWSESGTNFAEKLEFVVSGGSAGLGVQ